MEFARTHRLGRGGWRRNASAGNLPAPCTDCAAAKTQEAGAFAARNHQNMALEDTDAAERLVDVLDKRGNVIHIYPITLASQMPRMMINTRQRH